MNGLRLRPGRVEDAPALSALILRFSAELTLAPDGAGAERFFDSVSAAALARLLADPRYLYVVAMQGDTLAGFAGLRDRSHLFHLFVAPGFQRRGLATRLWQALRGGFDDGAVRFSVNSSPLARPFYERLGFVADGPCVEMNGLAFVPMTLASSSPPHA